MQYATVWAIDKWNAEKWPFLKCFKVSMIQQNTDSEYTYSVIKCVTLIEKIEFERTRKFKQSLIFD